MKLNEKVKPLFTTQKRYIIITGGRGSSKSFSTSTFLTLLTYEAGHRILFTRYTMTSAEISIIPEFKQKLELLNIVSEFIISSTDIKKINTGSEILFRGIKTSSGIQTANLKSLQGITTWVIDEAEELIDERTFDKIDLSVRNKEKQNRIIIVINPTVKDHWIWSRFFENTHKFIEIDSYKVPISTHPEVEHIHLSYLDNKENLSDSFIEAIEKIKLEDKQRYYHEIIGGWKMEAEGTLFRRSDLKRFSKSDYKEEGLEATLAYADIADEGDDSFAMPIARLFKNKVFITDIIFTKDNIDITMPRTVAAMRDLKINYLRVESNNQGSIFIKSLREKVSPEKVLKVSNTANKHSRIILEYAFIKEYFYFLEDKDIIPGSDYDKFMRELFDYLKDGTSKHDDAPDSISGLAKFIHSFMPNLFR